MIDSGLARYPFWFDKIDLSGSGRGDMKDEELKLVDIYMMLPTPVERLSFGAHERGPMFRIGQSVYFFPLFLMPWPPVLRGPLPPALAASSLRALASVAQSAY